MSVYKAVDTEKLESDLTGVADEVRTLADTTSKMSLEAMKGNIAEANEKVDSQSAIIAQIKRALQGKADSGGDLSAIETLIDESGVLDSTEGTVEEKVEQLVDKAEYENFFTQLRFFKCEGNHNIVKTPLLDCINLKSLESAFSNCGALEEIYVKNTQNVTTWINVFGSPKIKTIETLDFSSANSIPYGLFGADYITNIKIVPNTIKADIRFGSRLLTSESIDGIINGLTVVETSKTLTLPSNNTLTDEQKATINAKGWTLAQ